MNRMQSHALRRARPVFALIACLGSLAGCNSDEPSVDERPGITGDATKGDAPAPARGTGTPQETVIQLRRAVLVGDVTVTSLYDPRVIELLGTETTLGALNLAAGSLVTQRARITEAQSSGTGVLVVVEATSTGQAPTRTSYLLERRDGRWVVTYDGLLTESLGTYIAQQFDIHHPDGSDVQSDAAAEAGQLARRRFRAALTDGPRRGRLDL